MANVAITDEQRISLRNNPRFIGLVKVAIKNYARELILLNGTAGNLDNLTPVEWAKYRLIAKAIILGPNAQDYDTWIEQFITAINAVVIWDNVLNTEDAAINNIIAAGVNGFRAYIKLVYGVRAERIEF